jgi:hypothetical protein
MISRALPSTRPSRSWWESRPDHVYIMFVKPNVVHVLSVSHPDEALKKSWIVASHLALFAMSRS